MKRSDLAWGGLFLLLWMGKYGIGIPPFSPRLALGVGVLLVLYSHLKCHSYTFLKMGLALPFLGNEQIMFAYGISLIPFLILSPILPAILAEGMKLAAAEKKLVRAQKLY